MSGDIEALIVACIPSLRRYARGLTGDRDRADDLVQDTLERAWRRYSRWQRRGELRAWMFGIMHNHFIDGLRAQKRQPELAGETALQDLPARPTQDDGLAVRDLDRSLARLSADQRAIILLISVEEFSYEEAARVLDVPIGTVMSRLSRARERLAALLAEAPPTRVAATLHRIKP
ncbi:RNA polymerase sigma factor [Bordetella holmesii]|uniref:ECF sigma factor n=2 Tax=Bordetella holmesii TaxID=35814 RepID=A0A158M5V2_9BORD|nr:RNA polymerase sigma factor [Bordetella holmesii]AHV92208.1 RNA polymerase sigma factor, sigma-70 family protein [Bordetella holmesii ATCC 51541]AIT27499.1 RNA polymerase sigma factor, sigma-70 family protein [Bordetella holmesii 44057]EWM42362.1 RNA polymerase sigma factor, sigma-70 family protein [Bordetella holmesii 41130]EWM48089.1 RNA polymerase sigma factor, sigma-70 family protein [Bordetella holmesii 35009]EWM49073.1 RNA polymerase sigma factor, sigma-70 family protein [Bordetella h